MATRNLTMSRPTRQQTTKPTVFKPHELAARDVIASLDKGIKPDVAGIELGNLKTDIDILIEAFDAGSYQDARPSFLKCHTRLASLTTTTATPDQDTEQDTRIVTSENGERIFRTIVEDDLDLFKPPKFIIKDLLTEVGVSLWHGSSNVGKTFNAWHIAECIAHELTYFGERKSKQGIVLYICAEGGEGELLKRSRAWRLYHGKPSTPNIRIAPYPIHLKEEYETLCKTVEHLRPSLVVVDTFSNCAVDVDQDKQMQVAAILMLAHKIAQSYQCHVLIVHHDTWGGKVNGSAAFKNHVDAMFRLERATDSSPISIICEKLRGGSTRLDPPINVALEVVSTGLVDDDLEPITSCVVVESAQEVETGSSGKKIKLSEKEAVLYGLLSNVPVQLSDLKRQATDAGILESSVFYLIGALEKRNLAKKYKEGRNVFVVRVAEQSNGDDEP